jgi:pimeloyl-ACP methyl ester carboxylesterase
LYGAGATRETGALYSGAADPYPWPMASPVFPIDPLLPQIRVPTLLIVGEHDVISTPTEMQGIAAAISGAKCVVVPNAGHMAPLEQPAAVNAAMREFLR